MSGTSKIHVLKALIVIGMVFFPLFIVQAKIEQIQAVDWNYDGTKLTIGHSDGTVEIRDLISGETKIYEPPSQLTLTSLSWSPDDNRIAVADNRGFVSIFDVATDQLVLNLDAGDYVTVVIWRPEGNEIITAVENTTSLLDKSLVLEWDAITGEDRGAIVYPAQVWAIAMSPDGNQLAAAAAGDGAAVWTRTEAGPPTNLGERVGNVGELAWSPDGTKIATGNDDGELRVWSWPEVDLDFTFQVDKAIRGIAWSPDNSRLALIDSYHVNVLDTATGQVLYSIETDEFLNTIAWNPIQDLIAYGGSSDTVQIVAPSDLSTPTPVSVPTVTATHSEMPSQS